MVESRSRQAAYGYGVAGYQSRVFNRGIGIAGSQTIVNLAGRGSISSPGNSYRGSGDIGSLDV